MDSNDQCDSALSTLENAVGIVVQDGVQEATRPRAVAFVWGGKVRPAPSLPYGRWKKASAL